MKFTPKLYVVSTICGVLIGVQAGGTKANNPIGPTPFGAARTFTTNDNAPIMPAVERISLAGGQVATANDFVTVAWYKNKHWWKRNAPIIGGAGGGALVGGLAGGGTGALIGGAAGGGGGYLYKRLKRNHHYHHHE